MTGEIEVIISARDKDQIIIAMYVYILHSDVYLNYTIHLYTSYCFVFLLPCWYYVVITWLYENVLDRVYISGVASSGVARGAMGWAAPGGKIEAILKILGRGNYFEAGENFYGSGGDYSENGGNRRRSETFQTSKKKVVKKIWSNRQKKSREVRQI